VRRKPTKYSHKGQWQKIVVSTILNHKLLEYIKLSKILLSKCLVSIEDEWHLTLSISLGIDYEIGLACTLGWLHQIFESMFFYNEKFLVWTSHCQVAYQSSILCKCIGSNMHVLSGLQNENWMVNQMCRP
jgi:hypothetical protein